MTSLKKRSVGNWLIWTHKKTLITLKVIIWRNPVCDCLRLLHTPIVSLLFYFSYVLIYFFFIYWISFLFLFFFITDSINTCVTTYVTIVVQIQKRKKRRKNCLFGHDVMPITRRCGVGVGGLNSSVGILFIYCAVN